MSEGIMFQAFAYKSPERRIRRVGLYAAIAERLVQSRKKKEDDRNKDTHFGLASIFAVGQSAVGAARAKLTDRHFRF
jgi:hypothetical protein